MLNRSNFLGMKFTVYDAHPPCDGAVFSKVQSWAQVIGSTQTSSRVPAGNYQVSHISYEMNAMGSRYVKNT
jgi:tubby and related proteins